MSGRLSLNTLTHETNEKTKVFSDEFIKIRNFHKNLINYKNNNYTKPFDVVVDSGLGLRNKLPFYL